MHTIYTDEVDLPSGIVMEIHCHITGIFEAAVRLRLHLVVQCNLFMIFPKYCYSCFVTKRNSQTFNAT